MLKLCRCSHPIHPSFFSAPKFLKLDLEGCCQTRGRLSELKDLKLIDINLKGCVKIEGSLADFRKFKNKKRMIRLILDDVPLSE